jgi:hypothetical protein
LITRSKLDPLGVNPYRLNKNEYPFVGEAIWIDKELDLSKLNNDKSKYDIPPEYIEGNRSLNPNKRNILLDEVFKQYLQERKLIKKKAKEKGIDPGPEDITAGYVSIRELHGKWLDELTPKRVKSKDLLDQILLCYTIKRASNGYRTSILKLYNLYKETAGKIAYNMARSRGLFKNREYRYEENVNQEAMGILQLIIGGLNPESIIKSLQDENGNPYVNKWIESFYYWHLTENIPRKLDMILSGEKSPILLQDVLNPYSPFFSNIIWKGTPIRKCKLNSFVFRPSKKTNLTTWLFGIKGDLSKGAYSGSMQGKFCQLLNEIVLNPMAKLHREFAYSFSDVDLEECDDKQAIAMKYSLEPSKIESEEERKRREDLFADKIDQQVIINKMKEGGISSRNAEIFLKHKIMGLNKTKLAEEYSLNRRTIYRIIKDLSSKYPI